MKILENVLQAGQREENVMIDMLSYIGFTSPARDEWTTFGPQVLGAELAEPGPDGAVRLRLDDAGYRIAVHYGERDDLRYLGWGTATREKYDEGVAALEAAGVAVIAGSPELALERNVVELVTFNDPFGVRNELSWGQLSIPATFRPGRAISGFVTGHGGLGHVVLLVPDLEQAEAFYCGVLGFRLTDTILVPGVPRLRFYNCNERHHSLAFIEVPEVKGFHHLMLEARSIDDVGNALDLATKGAAEVTQGLGRHTNDHMTSFYLRTPSSFEIEYGWGGIMLEPEAERPRQFNRLSIWGHRPTGGQVSPPGIITPLDGAAAPAPPQPRESIGASR